jgi:hypothetical protein
VTTGGGSTTAFAGNAAATASSLSALRLSIARYSIASGKRHRNCGGAANRHSDGWLRPRFLRFCPLQAGKVKKLLKAGAVFAGNAACERQWQGWQYLSVTLRDCAEKVSKSADL